MKSVKSRPFRHGRRDCDKVAVFIGQLDERLAKNTGISWRGVFFRDFFPCCHNKRSCTMEFVWAFFGRGIALSLFCKDMDEHWFSQILGFLQSLYKRRDIMSVHRSQIFKTQVLKKHPWHKEVLQGILESTNGLGYVGTNGRNGFKHAFYIGLDSGVGRVCAQFRQVGGQGSHVAGNGHFIVI